MVTAARDGYFEYHLRKYLKEILSEIIWFAKPFDDEAKKVFCDLNFIF